MKAVFWMVCTLLNPVLILPKVLLMPGKHVEVVTFFGNEMCGPLPSGLL